MSKLRRCAQWVTVIAASAVAQVALAEIEQVIVTAQKREQNLQETPISIAAFTADDLDRRGIADVEEVSNSTPNLHINTSQGDSTTAVMSMRGLSQPNASNLGNEAAVGLYFDGVYIGKGTATVFDLADVERIEVLRGPQGTLYGKNTIGGAINVISARPTGRFEGDARLGLGDNNLFYSKANVNLPAIGEIGSGLGAFSSKISIVSRRRDGIVDNRPLAYSPAARPSSTADGFGEQDILSGRFAFDLEVTDQLVFSYAYDRSRVRNTTPFFQLLDVVAGGMFDPATGSARALRYADYLQPDEPSTGSSDYQDNRDDADVAGHALTVEWDLNDSVALRSITAYRDFSTSAASDYDGSNLSLYHVQRDVEYDQFSQELQLTGSSNGLKWVAGLYYFEEDGTYYSPRTVFGEFSGNNVTHSFARIDNDLRAIYGQGDWTPARLPKLTLSVGGRYSEETKNAFRSAGDFDVGLYTIPPTQLPELKLDPNFSAMASAAWQFTPSLNMYAKYSEGYRSGGYDGQTTSAAAFAIPYESEEVASYELGLKSLWLEDRLQVNVAGFFSDYDNLQITVFDAATASSYVANAGKAEITGLELEVLAQLHSNVQLSAGYGWLDPQFKEYRFVNAAGQASDIAGIAKFTHTPKNSVTAGLDWQVARTSIGTLGLFLNYTHKGEHYVHPHTNGQVPNGRIDAYSLLDVRLALTEIPVGGVFKSATFALWGKNVTDEGYVRTNIDFGSFLAGTYGDPRTIGADLQLKF